MGPLYDQVGGDGGLPSSTSNNMNNNNERKSGFRKYALLIQDSLAIKFVPVTPTESPQFPHASYSAGNHPSVGFSNNGNPIISDNPHESISNNNETSEKSVNKRDHISLSNNGGGTTSTGGLLRSSRGLLADRNSPTSASRDVDHSLHALYLFKGFQESNLKCYWNGGLSETIRNIEYKGYIVPSIILVTALPRYLTILRTAWSRRMLRSPPGYRIKFIGEVEELVAEPIGQGQFAPLSDSLCWAILELTSIGEEAFVDPIMTVLKGKFPSMSCPSRELVFQTLEKLIRERKIYQTANGYFVVTPDTFRFMTSAAPQHLFNPSINLDALIPYDDTPDKSFHNPWESHQLQSHPKDVTDDKTPVTNERTTADSTSTTTPSNGNKLKRHSSLKTFRQRDICDAEGKESFGRRGTSMRLSKSLSCDQMDKDNEKEGDEEGLKSPKIGRRSTLSQITTLMRNFKMNVSDSSSRSKRSTKFSALDRNTKGKSLFSRLFGRSRSKSREPREPRDEISSLANTNGAAAITVAPANITTTLVPVSSDEASSSSAHSSPAHVRSDTTDSALYDVLSDPSTSSSIGDNNKLSSLDQQDNLHDDDHHHHHHTPFPVPANFPSFHSRDEPSRCSTLSHATSSLGYGSEGYPSLNLSSPSSTHSPCPYESLRNTSTRHSINNGQSYSTGGMKASKRNTTSAADFYQRRYPSYSHSFSRNSPYYASLTSPTRIKVPTHSLYDSLLTTTSSSQSTPKSNEFSKPSPYGNKQHISETTGMNETKVTQTVKSTTDMELQLLLPLGNIMKAAINAKKQELKDNFFREEFNREPPPPPSQPHQQQSQNRKSSNNTNSQDSERDHDIPIHLDKSSGIKVNVSEPKSQTEIKTKIDKNGVVEEHYQTLPNVDISNTRSKVEININGKSLDFGWTNHNGKIRKISTQHVEQKTSTDSSSPMSPSPHNTTTSTPNPTTCGQFDNNSINGNYRTSKWSKLGGVTLCNNVGQGFQDDIKVSII